MQNNEEKIPDKWELALNVQIVQLQQCQESKALVSCSLCNEFIDCSIRKQYVNAVYESMSKGTGGGFEF
jgi:hypothetical protein